NPLRIDVTTLASSELRIGVNFIRDRNVAANASPAVSWDRTVCIPQREAKNAPPICRALEIGPTCPTPRIARGWKHSATPTPHLGPVSHTAHGATASWHHRYAKAHTRAAP